MRVVVGLIIFATATGGGTELLAASSRAPLGDRFGTSPPRHVTLSKPADTDTRRELTKELQRELKRVGCYEGEINGRWGAESKRAMSDFTDRVNATLPVEEPDHILLALVQGHAARICGKSCPSGQELAGNGRCLPRTVLARRARKDAANTEQRMASGRQESADQVAGSVIAPGQALSAPKAMAWSSDIRPPSEHALPPQRTVVEGATGASATTGAAPPEKTATTNTRVTSSANPRFKPNRLVAPKQGPLAQEDKPSAAQRHGMLPAVKKLRPVEAVKKVRSPERPAKGRLLAGRPPPPRIYRASPPAYRTASRSYAYRRALAAWWLRWQYAAYGGMAGYWR